MIKDYFKLSYNSVKKRKLRSWLTMLGIFIGIAAVVALISLSQGLKSAIAEQFTQLGSDKLTIQAAGSGFGPPGTAVTTPLTIDNKKEIEQIKEIEIAVGRLLRTVKLEYDREIKYSYVVSLPEENSEIQFIIEANNYKISDGRMLEKKDKYKVVIGYDFADNFFDKKLELKDKIKVQEKEFEVVGILKKSGNPQSDSTLILPEEDLRELLSIEEDYDLIAAQIKTGESIGDVTEKVNKKLRSLRQVEEGQEDFSVQTPEQLLNTLNTILLTVQGILIGIAAISLLVGGVGIMNTMYTAVLERTKEIGIMKATGARNQQILTLFLIESGMLGLFGGIIGVSLGFTISKLVEIIAFKIYGSYLINAQFSLLLMVGSLTFAFLVGASSGVLPAKQAASLKPVEAFRK